MLFGALLQNWKVVAFAVLVATMLLYRAVLVHQRDSARAQVTALIDAGATLRAANASMAAAVARQNAQLAALQDRMKLALQAAAQRHAQATDAAARALGHDLANADAIRNAPVPAGCQGAIVWGNAQGPELGRW